MNTNRDKNEMRQFGLMFALILAILFGVLIPLVRHGASQWSEWPLWPWMVSLIIVAWALLHQASLRLLHGPWMKFAAVAQWVNTRLIMLLLFYFLMLPIGLLLRLFGKDSMHRRFDPDAKSYRVVSEKHPSSHLEKPF